jgi:hypothetical protein
LSSLLELAMPNLKVFGNLRFPACDNKFIALVFWKHNEKRFVQKSFKEEAEELVELLFRGGLFTFLMILMIFQKLILMMLLLYLKILLLL